MSSSASASDWRLTSIRYTRFGLSMSFIDTQSIHGGNGQVHFSTLTFFNRRTSGMNRVSTTVTADCPSKVYSFQQITLFRDQHPLSNWHSTVQSTATPQSNLFDAISSACGITDFGVHVERIETFAANYFRKRPRRG